MPVPGSPFGASVVQYASGTISAALAAERFGAQFFADGGHPSSLLYADREVTEDQAKNVKRAFLAATRGTREPAVLGSDWKYEQVQINPDDSQFIDLLRFEVENTCRFMGVPPSMVYGAVSGQHVTYANVSQADLHFLRYSLESYLTRFERAWFRMLPRPQVARFNRDAFLRSDPLGRMQVHEIALRNRLRSVNEVRRIEDEPPFDDPAFDAPGVPGGAPAPPVVPTPVS
jgi:HK97 family phage portal protein